MLPRVVITGMGVVSPNGIGKEAFCRAIFHGGKFGSMNAISRFDPIFPAGSHCRRNSRV